MANLSDECVTANTHWNSSDRPCEKSQKMDKGAELYLTRSDPEDCECDIHGIEVKQARYRELANKELRLRDELMKVNQEMIDFTSFMLENIACTDKMMKSVYETDFEKRGLPIAQYKPLMAAVDSPVRTAITPATIGLKKVYKDPIKFKYSALESPIQPAKTIALLKVSESCSFWDQPLAGCSEYMDTISRTGMINMKNQQQYLKPFLPPRNFTDCDLIKSI